MRFTDIVLFIALLFVPAVARGQAAPKVHELKASPSTVHRGFFDASLKPVLTIDSGDIVRLETATGNPRYFEKLGIDATVRLSYGATEAAIPDVADAIVELTETGSAIRAAGLKIIDTVLTSYTELVANPVAYQDPDKRHAMQQVLTLLQGTLEARGKVLVKLNVGEADLDRVIGLLPSMKSPTVSKLFGDGGYAVETVVPKDQINVLIPALKDGGASDIIELPLSKIVH